MDNDTKADAKANRLSRPVAQTDMASMIQAYEAVHGLLPSRETPSKGFLGSKLEQVEANEPIAEILSEVTSRDEGEEDFLGATVTSAGQIQLQRGTRKGSMPIDPEELRLKHKLLGNTWTFIRFRHSNRLWLADMEPKVFRRFSDWILGETVYGLRAAGGVGPTWKLVLDFEKEARKAAYERVRRGKSNTIAIALQEVEDDAMLRNLFLITPFTLGHQSGPVRQIDPTGGREQKDKKKKKQKKAKKDKGGVKDDDGNKGKGKGKGKVKLMAKTADGRMICFAYNNEKEGCTGSCSMLHVCRVCGGDHPMFECPKAKKQ